MWYEKKFWYYIAILDDNTMRSFRLISELRDFTTKCLRRGKCCVAFRVVNYRDKSTWTFLYDTREED